MQVNLKSGVADPNSFLYQWDVAARKNFSYFEEKKIVAKEGFKNLFRNFLTRWRDPIHFYDRIHEGDILAARQLIGEISQDEVNDLNKSYGSKNLVTFGVAWNEPARLYAYSSIIQQGLVCACFGMLGFSLFVKKFNITWFGWSFLPLATFHLYNVKR